MRGIKVRTPNHLFRLVGDKKLPVFLTIGYGFVRYATVRTEDDVITFEAAPDMEPSGYEEFFSTYRMSVKNNYPFDNVILLNKSFPLEYDNFINSNKKFIKQSIPGFDEEIPSSLKRYLFYLTDGSKNFYVWALKQIHYNRVDIETINHIMYWYDVYGKSSSTLSRGTITAYSGREQINALLREMIDVRRNKRCMNTINSFNTAQKKILKEVDLTDSVREIFSKFSKLSKAKKHNFIRKMSTVYDPNEIIKQMSFLTSTHFSWDKESVLNFINNAELMDCEVVYNDKNILLVDVRSYDTIKKLAKTTNWCISKNKKYWNQYFTEGKNKQFVMFDFSKKEDDVRSIVGFTVLKDVGITEAHDFKNNNLMSETTHGVYAGLDTIGFLERYYMPNDIYSILKNKKIPEDLVTYNSGYKFNREDFLKLFKDEFFLVISDSNNKMVFETDIPSIRRALNPDFFRGMSDNESVIGFANFNDEEKITNNLFFVPIVWDSTRERIVNETVYNQNGSMSVKSIFRLADEYNFPSDMFCLDTRPLELFNSSLESRDITSCRCLLDKEEVREAILKDSAIKNYDIGYKLLLNTFDLNTDEFIDMFYEHGIKLTDVCTNERFMLLVEQIVSKINRCMETPKPITEKMRKKLIDKEIKDVNLINYICYSDLLKRIIINECVDDEKAYSILENLGSNLSHLNAISLIVSGIIENMKKDICSWKKTEKQLMRIYNNLSGTNAAEFFDFLNQIKDLNIDSEKEMFSVKIDPAWFSVKIDPAWISSSLLTTPF